MPTIKFLTADPVVAKHFAVEPLKKNIPGWYKDVPRLFSEERIDDLIRVGNNTDRSVKACIPVQDYLTSGYLIKTVSHTKFRNTPGSAGDVCGVSYYTTDVESIATHGHKQCPVHIEGKRKTYIKFNSPWIIKTQPGYSCLFYQPFFHMEDRFTVLPAIVDTDTYDLPVNFPGFIKGDAEVEVMPGEPLIAVFPFKRESWVSEVICEPERKPSLFSRFLNEGYKRAFWTRKSYR